MQMSRQGRSGSRAVRILTTFVLAVAVAVAAPAAQAAEGDVGYRDFAYGAGAGSGWVDPDLAPTASKPQSKLWFAQDRWWGVLLEPSSQDTHIYSLDAATQTWQNTGVVVDTRSASRADALWDGQHLYVASHVRSGSSSSNGVVVTRYSFTGGRYVPDAGFPVRISSGGVEAAVIAKDTTGRLWVTYTQSGKVRVVVSDPGGLSWGAPFSPSVAGVSVSSDDISTIASYDGQVSVVWSNQNDDSIYAATHLDGTATTSWAVSRKILTGPNEADDHINLAGVEGDAAGRLYAVVKTGQNDVKNNSNAPLIKVLVLGTDDVWRQYTHSRVRDGLTRPIVLVDSANRMLRVLASGPESGGVVYMKSAPLDALTFPEGKGEPFIALASDKNINNATSTKQPLTAASGLVVLASDQVTGRYVHNTMALGGSVPPPPSAPVAAFSATGTSGPAPLAVGFTDASTGAPSSWSWDFGDGGTSTAQHPTHTYQTQGTYDVSLTVTNSAGTDTETKVGLVTVTGDEPPPPPPGDDYRSTVLAAGPVAYWRLGGTGSTVAAETGTSGTAVGGVTATAGALTGDPDGARDFDGSTGRVDVASSPALNMTGDLTVEAWVRPDRVHSGVVVQKGGPRGYPEWQYRLGMTSGGQWRGTVFMGSTARAVTAPGSAAIGKWTHLVLTRSGDTMTIFVDGTAVATASAVGSLNVSSFDLAIGRSGESTTSYFDGALDEVAVYDRALDAATVRAHHAFGGAT